MWKRAMAAAVGATVLAAGAVAGVEDAAWVEERVRQWQPTAREKRWESIGWTGSIRQAMQLAREHRRPVFLFTLDGRMGVGRC